MARKFREDINYYKLLQVDPQADPKVIKSSYHTILNKLCCHPDKGGDEEETKLINEAYQILSSIELRREYDAFLVEVARRKSQPYPIPGGEGIRSIRYREWEEDSTYPGDPFAGISRINDAFNRLLQDFFQGEPDLHYHQREWNPPVNIYRQKNNLIIKLEVPGVPWQDIHIEVKNDIISIFGEKRPEPQEYVTLEFPYGVFHRSFKLPGGLEVGKMTARLVDGILEVVIPGSPVKKSRIIPITQL